MRRAERPPFIKEGWELGKLLDELIDIKKITEFSEINDHRVKLKPPIIRIGSSCCP